MRQDGLLEHHVVSVEQIAARPDLAAIAASSARRLSRCEPARSEPDSETDELVARLIDADPRPAFPEPAGRDDTVAFAEIAARAARRLGEMWVEDRCGFCDVTLGLHRLTLRLHEVEAVSAAAPGHSGCALLASLLDDQHGFGLAIVAAAMRRAGWDVTAETATDADTILAALVAGRHRLLGLSIGHERAVPPAAALIRAVRASSRGREVRIAVGGPMILGNAPLAHALGADLWADDAEGLLVALDGVAADIAATGGCGCGLPH